MKILKGMTLVFATLAVAACVAEPVAAQGWQHHREYHEGYHGGYHRGGGWVGPALVGGLLVGALIESNRQPVYETRPNVVYSYAPQRELYDEDGRPYHWEVRNMQHCWGDAYNMTQCRMETAEVKVYD